MVTLNQFTQHTRCYGSFDVLNRATFLESVDDRDIFALHCTVVSELRHSTTGRQQQFIGQFTLIKQFGELL